MRSWTDCGVPSVSIQSCTAKSSELAHAETGLKVREL